MAQLDPAWYIADLQRVVSELQAENTALRQDNMVQKNTAYVLLKAATEARERIEQLEAALRPFVRDGACDPMDPAVIRARRLLPPTL